MTSGSDFPLNAWYAAAWDIEIAHNILPRVICDIPLILYRRRDRTVVALEDACWHRLLPLSKGRLDGDEVVCGYHGMTFDSQGQCVRMPSQDMPPRGACIRAFRVVERHRLVWLWPGDPERADPGLIPDMHWADDPQWATEGSYMAIACDYRLALDNLMDLTHEAFVHATSIGHEKIVEAPFDVEHTDRTVTLSRWMVNVEAPPFLAMQLQMARGLPAAGVDRWQIIRFEAPSTIVIDVGVAQTGSGAPEGDRTKGVTGQVLNTLTPASRGQCHYFFGFARCFALPDRALTSEIRGRIERIFAEDKIILEAQQKAIDRRPDCHFKNLNIDAGSARVRRIIDSMTAAEREHRLDGKSGDAADVNRTDPHAGAPHAI